MPLAPGEESGTPAPFSPLIEQRNIDFARASLPNVGGITEMLKIMAICDTHKVGAVPHFTSPIPTAAHMHTLMAFPGQALMEFNLGDRRRRTCRNWSNAATARYGRTIAPGLGSQSMKSS